MRNLLNKLKEFLRENLVVPSRLSLLFKVLFDTLSLIVSVIFYLSAFTVGSLLITKWLIETNLKLSLILLVPIVYGFIKLLKMNK
jgi:hypothetical protein